MGAPGPVRVNWQQILTIADESTKTIGNINTAVDQLGTHISDLNSGMVGFGEEIPSLMQKWQSALTEVNDDLSKTKTQLEAIAAHAKKMLELAGGGAGGR